MKESKNKIKIIAAVGKNLEIGKNNDLIWKLSEDLKFFRNETMNKTIVMGYNTFKSLPHLLKGRNHVVLSFELFDNDKVTIFNDFNKLCDYIKSIDDSVYIIGGASIYKLFIDIADEIILTEIDDVCNNADVYFPKFDKDNYNKKLIKEVNENGLSFKHVKYIKK